MHSADGDDEGTDELIQLFVTDLAKDIESLRRAVRNNDLQQIETIAYQIKGCSGGYGFPRLSLQAARLETSIRSGSLINNIQAEVEALIEHCETVVEDR